MNDNSEIELNLDYMLTLKMSFEIELELDDTQVSLVRIINQMYRYLKNQRKSNDEIKNGISLLYTEIDPANKDDALYVLDRIIATETPIQYHTSATFINMLRSIQDAENQLNEQYDRYTGDIINAPSVFDLFNTNLNNLHHYYTTGPSGTTIEEINSTGFTGSETGHTGHTGTDDEDTETYDELSTNSLALLLSTHNSYNTYNVPLLNSFIYRPFFNALMNGLTGINNRVHEDVKNIATPEILDKNTVIIKYDDPSIKDNCPICLEGYNENSIIRKLNCSHIFHKDCIDSWLLKESYKCPICRNDSLPHTHI